MNPGVGLVMLVTVALTSAAQPGFEVASIKQNTSAGTNGTWRFTGGGLFNGENINLRFLISTAFQLRDYQLSGIPGWADSAKYDIAARGEGAMDESQIRAMLQSLLEDRFKLKYHRVTKEGPVYALIPARSGIRVQESKEGPCTPPDPKSHEPVTCDTWFSYRNRIEAKRTTMPHLAQALSMQTDRPVIDKTGFTRSFDAVLEWTPTEVSNDPNGDTGPSIFTALQEQLGLKLESQKGQVETLVIDHIEMPGEN